MNLEKAKFHLESGGLIAYPTETVWGLGAVYDHLEALDLLLELKGREIEKGISLLVADLSMARQIAQLDDPRYCRFLEIVWPGPLAVVAPARPGLPEQIQGGTGHVGMRLSSHPLVAKLIQKVGKPVTTTSANRSGASPALKVTDLDWLPVHVGVLEGGEAGGQQPSSVVRLSNKGLEILRQGSISKDELLRLGHLCRLPLVEKNTQPPAT